VTQTTTHMLSEIREIPAVTRRFLSTQSENIARTAEMLRARDPNHLVTVARGSSDHASTMFKYACEQLMGLPVASVGPSVISVYDRAISTRGGACVAMSQSGKSPDLLALAGHYAKDKAPLVVLTNNIDSPLAHLTSYVISLEAGPELSVAATKSFVATAVASLAVLAKWSDNLKLKAALANLPTHLEQALETKFDVVLSALETRGPVLVFGRGVGTAMAAEAALKLKETCGLQAEAYSSAELRHGPIEMVNNRFTAIGLIQDEASKDGVLETAHALRAQGATVFLMSAISSGDIPSVHTGSAYSAALCQIVALYSMIEALSRHLGRNPDKPKALRKVTETV
jgi:glucosamine--fructose-6-phosphate aminotransferase (isomerizing)